MWFTSMSKDRLKKCATAMVAGGSERRIAPALHYPIRRVYIDNIYNFCSSFRDKLPLGVVMGGY